MPSARCTGRDLLARVVARVLIAALVFGLLPVPAQASLPATSRAAAARLDPPADLPLRDQTSSTVLVFVSEDEELCAVLVVVADPMYPSKYHRARWMDPRAGRFAGMDPFPGSSFDPPSLHRYLYAAADPANKVDPTGAFTMTFMGSLSVAATLIAAHPTTAILVAIAIGVIARPPLPPGSGPTRDPRGRDHIFLFHGTTATRAQRIVGTSFYPREGFNPAKAPIYFAEDFATAAVFAATRVLDPGETQPTRFSVIEFKIPYNLAWRLGLLRRDPIGLGVDRPIDPAGGTGFERILRTPVLVVEFNVQFFANLILATRFRLD